jgi:nicotinamidase-related amidase
MGALGNPVGAPSGSMVASTSSAEKSMHDETGATLTMTTALSSSYDDRLTRDNAALLLIDHQVGPLWELELAAPRRRVTALARVAERLGIPTIVTAIAPESWGPIIPELTAVYPESSVIVRAAVNAWDDARVRSAVESTGRTTLIIAGSTTEVGVAPCAVAAVRDGYAVFAPVDASGQCSNRALVRLSQGGVIVTTVELVVRELSSQ